MVRAKEVLALGLGLCGLLAAGGGPANAQGGGKASWGLNFSLDRPADTVARPTMSRRDTQSKGKLPPPRLLSVAAEAVPSGDARSVRWALEFLNIYGDQIRVSAKLALEDSSGKATATAKKSLILLPHEETVEIVEMELESGAWERSAKLEIALKMEKF
jgi:hypothetical protein